KAAGRRIRGEELFLDVVAANDPGFDGVVAVQLISADDAIDPCTVRDPRAYVLAFLVVEDPGSDTHVESADFLGLDRSRENDARHEGGGPTHPWCCRSHPYSSHR